MLKIPSFVGLKIAHYKSIIIFRYLKILSLH